MDEPARPVKIWCLLRDQLGHAKPIEKYFGARAQFIYDGEWDCARILAASPDLVLCVNDFPHGVAKCLDAARGARIPSLVLQDGILEWRCQYENPLFGAGGGAPQHQPVLADKIACIGEESARQIAAWGNTYKVEVTGMPRLDDLLELDAPPPKRPGSRLLVMTAKKPGFTPEQTELTLRSLRDLRDFLSARPNISVIWRLTKDLAQQLGVENQLKELASAELAKIISGVDAVVTTISTSILEAMILGRPIAALDYHNVPRFVPTTWSISAPEHIPTVVSELLNPSPRKLAYQDDCLRDCLACDGPSTPRVALLIERLATAGREARSSSSPMVLPCVFPVRSSAGAAHRPSLSQMYPDQPTFTEQSLEYLQVRLARAEKENEQLKAELQQRRIGYWMSIASHRIAERIHTLR